MDDISSITAKEVIDVLYSSNIELFRKIPPKFISFLKQKAYGCEGNIQIDKESISDDAKAILAIIYKDFLVDNIDCNVDYINND